MGLTGWKVSADECRAMLKKVGEAMKLEELCLTECICEGAVLIRPDDLASSARPYVLIMTDCDYASRLAGVVCEALGRPMRLVYHPPVRRVVGAPKWAFEVGNISELVDELCVEVNVDRFGASRVAHLEVFLLTTQRRMGPGSARRGYRARYKDAEVPHQHPAHCARRRGHNALVEMALRPRQQSLRPRRMRSCDYSERAGSLPCHGDMVRLRLTS